MEFFVEEQVRQREYPDWKKKKLRQNQSNDAQITAHTLALAQGGAPYAQIFVFLTLNIL